MSAAEIAGKLTKAQRAMVLASDPDDVSGEEGCGIDIRGSQYRVARALCDLGLGTYTHGRFYADMYWNNAAGLEVRAILQEQER